MLRGRHGCLMVSAPDSKLDGLGSSPSRGIMRCVLGNSHSASVHPGVKMGTGEFTAVG